jgi:hypothetical protein
VVAPARTAAPAVANADPSAELSTEAPADAPSGAEWYDARRAATRKATRRRRRVLSFLLVVLVAVVAACATGRIAWVYVAVPTGLLVAWLVACRLMVRRERAVGPISVHAATDEAPEDAGEVKAQVSDSSPTEGPRDPKLWDPVPMTLPTYVSKPPARRSVRTIDLDSTGVWTSGRTAADAALAREAEAADRVRRRVDRKRDQGDEAVGS